MRLRLWVIRDRRGRSRTTVYVRFAPKADNEQTISTCPLSATAVIRTCAAHDDGFRALVHQPVWHELAFGGGIYQIVSEHAAGFA